MSSLLDSHRCLECGREARVVECAGTIEYSKPAKGDAICFHWAATDSMSEAWSLDCGFPCSFQSRMIDRPPSLRAMLIRDDITIGPGLGRLLVEALDGATRAEPPPSTVKHLQPTDVVRAMIRANMEPLSRAEVVEWAVIGASPPVDNCVHRGDDGCCNFPDHVSAECHAGAPCPLVRQVCPDTGVPAPQMPPAGVQWTASAPWPSKAAPNWFLMRHPGEAPYDGLLGCYRGRWCWVEEPERLGVPKWEDWEPLEKWPGDCERSCSPVKAPDLIIPGAPDPLQVARDRLRASRERREATPPPALTTKHPARYDDVFAEGTARLDADGGEPDPWTPGAGDAAIAEAEAMLASLEARYPKPITYTSAPPPPSPEGAWFKYRGRAVTHIQVSTNCWQMRGPRLGPKMGWDCFSAWDEECDRRSVDPVPAPEWAGEGS